jgi:hypothetical protein
MADSSTAVSADLSDLSRFYYSPKKCLMAKMKKSGKWLNVKAIKQFTIQC